VRVVDAVFSQQKSMLNEEIYVLVVSYAVDIHLLDPHIDFHLRLGGIVERRSQNHVQMGGGKVVLMYSVG